MHKELQIYLIARKDEPPNVHDDFKLFAKNEKELKTLTHTIRIYCQYIGMEFGIERYAMLITHQL